MPRKRTEREIAERLEQLLNQQVDLQEQLGGLSTHLRSEIASLAGSRQHADAPAPTRNVDLDHVIDLLGRLAVAPTEADAVEVVVSAARQLLPGTRGALCLGTNGDDMAAVGVWDVDEQWNRPYQSDSPMDTPPQRLASRVASGPTGPADTFPVRGFGLHVGELRVWAEGHDDSVDRDQLTGRGELLARSAGLVLAGMSLQQSLRSHAVRDPLTGLFNRRYLLDTLARELHQARRSQAPLGLIMFDIDRFGQFNDRFGHERGDRMLQAIGKLMLARFRESDVACRFSGERFALLLPDADSAVSCRRAEEVRAAIEQFDIDGGRATVSVGVAAFPSQADRVETLIAAVESGILLARQDGGNRVHVAERG